MATIESSANFSGKNWGGYCRLTYTAGNGAISITGMAFKATNSTSASYDAHYDDNQTITVYAGSQSKSKQIAKVKINSTSYQAATDSYSSSSFTAVSFSGLSGNTNVSFTCKARSSSPNTLTFSFSINAGTAVVAPSGLWCSVTGKTETTATISGGYSSAGGGTITTSGYQYRTANGGWTNCGSSLSGLQPATTYYFRYYAGNSAGTSYSDGSANTTTFAYPAIITPTPNFTIGDALSIAFTNPMSRSCDIYVITDDGQQHLGGTRTSSPISPFNNSGWQNIWYGSIPNKPSGNYKVRLVCSAIGIDSTVNGGTYYANQSNCTPTFSDFTWADTNATTVALTGNNQVIVNGKSNVTATVSVANKATAKNSASIQKYVFKNGSQTQDITYSSSADVSNTISNATSNTLQVWAVDTRNFPSQTITKTASSFINYQPLSKTTASISRVGEVSSVTNLSFSGEIWIGDFGATTNAITSASYVYKTGNGGWSDPVSITPTVSGTSFSFNANILGDESDGFNVENVYTVVVTITDKLSTAEWTLTLNSGTPHIAYYKDGIAIKGKYNENIGGKLQVDGKIIENIGGTIKISNSNNQTMQPNIYTTLDFNFTYFNLSNQLSRSGNAVVIGKGINVILATAQWTAWSPSNYGRYLYIKRIRNNVTQDFLFYSLQYSSTINSSVVIPVQEGDQIIAGGYQEKSSAITLEAYETRTFLQVTILG